MNSPPNNNKLLKLVQVDTVTELVALSQAPLAYTHAYFKQHNAAGTLQLKCYVTYELQFVRDLIQSQQCAVQGVQAASMLHLSKSTYFQTITVQN